jgi:hypothetical protein
LGVENFEYAAEDTQRFIFMKQQLFAYGIGVCSGDCRAWLSSTNAFFKYLLVEGRISAASI